MFLPIDFILFCFIDAVRDLVFAIKYFKIFPFSKFKTCLLI